MCFRPALHFIFIFLKDKHIVSGYDTGNKFDERRLGVITAIHALHTHRQSSTC